MRLRFHLSTAVVVSLAAGWLMGINLLPNSYFHQEVQSAEWLELIRNEQPYPRYRSEVKHHYSIVTDHFGWPCEAATHQHDVGDSLDDSEEWTYHRRAIVIDALTALGFLLCVALTCEVAPCLLNRLYGEEKTLEFKPDKS
jgi:hypothetical protein